jgi:uncharacterized membrane protein YebE (DUF533 family)
MAEIYRVFPEFFMDAQALLERLLQAGREMTAKGKTIAEEKLKIPPEGPERDAMLSNMGKGALAASALALLLGTKGGRQLTGGALKLGSLAAVGGLAWKVYNDWKREQGGTAVAGKPFGELPAPEAGRRSLLLLRAMIAAAKSDGHIDASEKANINLLVDRLELDNGTKSVLQQELSQPLNAQSLAAGVESEEEAAEVYLTSLMVIDSAQPAERRYLDELAAVLKLDKTLIAKLESEAQKG